MATSPNINTGKVVTYAVYSNDEKVSDELRFRSITIHHEVNRIGSAVLKIIAGNMPEADIPESSSDNFKPGQSIKIELGYDNTNQTVFEGIVVAHKISIPSGTDTPPLLIVECKNHAIKATVARKNYVFESSTDSAAITTALGTYGLSVTVDSTSVTHTQLVQYYCTDWDFALSKADVNGLLVITDGNKVNIKAPEVSGTAVLTVTYGKDLISFDGELYAEDQFTNVEGVGWDPVTQEIVVAASSEQSLNTQGNLTTGDLAEAAGTEKITLQTDACSNSDYLESWANATLLKTGLGRYQGSFSFRGNAAAKPGTIIELAGMGSRFNGDVFVGSVTHTVKEGQWITEAGMGISPINITQKANVVAPPASGLLPGIQGLHIGVVTKLTEDPDSENRIQVKVPLLNITPNTIWARLGHFSAANSVGAWFVPNVNDEVVLGFINNDPNQAVILGSLYSGKYAPPYEYTDDNFKRAIITPEKLKVEMDDEKKIITITTPEKNSVVLDDDAKSITIQDQNKNKVELSSNGIVLSSEKDITLKAKGNIVLDATSKAEIKAKQDTSISGLNVNAKAQVGLKLTGSATAEISASGQTVVKGAMVMIN